MKNPQPRWCFTNSFDFDVDLVFRLHFHSKN